MRSCCQCGKIKSLSEFHLRGGSRRGRQARCKGCSTRTSREWIAQNPDRHRATKRIWSLKNPGKQHECSRAWFVAHPEKNKEYIGARRARQWGSRGRGITESDRLEILANSLGLCAYCGERRDNLTIDHIEPLSKGGDHDVENAAVACVSCNCKKHNTSLLVWIARQAAA